MAEPKSAAELLEAFGLDRAQAECVQVALQMLAHVPEESLGRVLDKLGHIGSVGPIIDPSAFVRTPRAWDNLRSNEKLVSALIGLRRLLPAEMVMEADRG